MKVDIDDVSTVKKTLRVEVPTEVVREEFSHAYASLNRRVRLPGFRPGKAPRALLEQHYAKQIQEEILRKLVPDSYHRALEEAGLKPVELPAIEQVQLKDGTPLTFSATVEVKPPIAVGGYKGLPLKPVPVVVTEADLDEAIGRLQERFAQLESHPADRAVETGDFVLVDLSGTVDGQPLPNSEVKGELFEIGKGLLKAPLEEAILGRRAGEQVEARLPLGQEAKPEWRDKEALFSITIREVKRKVLPAVDEELAKDAGSASLAELKEKLRAELERQRRQEAEATQKQALIKLLIDRQPFQVPQSMVDQELERIYRRVQPADQAHEPSPEQVQQFRATYEPLAVDRVKATLLLEAIAADEGLTVTEEEVAEEIRGLAKQMKLEPAQVRRLLSRQDDSLEQVRRKVLDDKTLALLLAEAKIEA
ncbi:MAG TPA: trigger factor [Nitrospiria bacterium]|nr:trigger factor [Nitrospiria bacterium]